jgi:hypothetical protein
VPGVDVHRVDALKEPVLRALHWEHRMSTFCLQSCSNPLTQQQKNPSGTDFVVANVATSAYTFPPQGRSSETTQQGAQKCESSLPMTIRSSATA